ncbi:MAG: NTPase [Asgard group archaeon]|nr:NTPase [Asgard group archaeon]
MNHVLITGYPGTGKTTLIKKIIPNLNLSYAGFYTEEIRNQHGSREGFKIIGLSTKKEGLLAHIKIKSGLQVGKYQVAIDEFEDIALEEMTKEVEVIIIDEIGKMELFSEKFKQELINCLSKKRVLATIAARGGGQVVEIIKARKDCKLLEITKDNREQLVEKILIEIKQW